MAGKPSAVGILFVFFVFAGCVDLAEKGSGADGSGSGAGGAAAATGGAGGSAPAGSGGAMADTSTMVDAGNTNSGADGGGTGGTGGAGAEPHDFVCSELIGLWVASQWWGSFEKGVDNARWQFMFQHHGYLELFADPASPFWKNSIASACAAQSATPDRVIFLPFSLTLTTMEDWHAQLTRVVDTMKQTFIGVKRIELLSTLRSPGNMPCANDKDPNTIVPAYVDQAIAAVAAESGGLVTVGPKIELPDCSWWAGGTDLTGQGNTGVGQLMSAYYKAHP